MSEDDAIARWRRSLQEAKVPRSARDFAPTLEEELRGAAQAGRSREELAVQLRPGSGTARRDRVLRILVRLGWIERAIEAVSEVRDQPPRAGSR